MAKKQRLTETYVKKLKAPDPSGRARIIRDADLRGFGVLVSGRSDHKSYCVTYGSKFQRRTVGDVNLFTIDEARSRAIEMLKMMKQGVDPASTRKPTPTYNGGAVTLRMLLERRLADQKRPLRQAPAKPDHDCSYPGVLLEHAALT